jgi:hypothetical protein
LNRERVADVQQCSGGENKYAQLAEIFMLRLEATARAAKEAVLRFVPITLPVTKAS